VIGKIVNILGVVVAVVVIGSIVLFLGISAVELVVANTVLLWIVCSIIALLILAWILSSFNGKRLEDARRKYRDAPELCLHKKVQFTQQDLGVITFTTKWCKVCGKNLGPR